MKSGYNGAASPQQNTANRMRVIDLFSGAGGMSLGFSQAGYDVIAAVDNWEQAIECYRVNFPDHPIYNMDLSDWKGVVKKFREETFDIIIGGPPCQDFSEAGDQIEGERAALTKSFAKIIAALKPRYFVMENVPLAQKSNAYQAARRILKKAKYGLTEVILDASLCGVPQNRRRFFCIGGFGFKNRFLRKTLTAHQSDLPMTLRKFIGDEFDFDFYYCHPRTYGRRGVYSLDETAPTIRGCNRPMPKEYKMHKDDKADPRKTAIKSLSYKERARIQMFPAEYKWSDQNSANDKMVGNAVPVGLSRYVAECLLAYLLKGDDFLPMCFTEWLQKRKHIRVAAAGDNLSRYRRVKRFLIGIEYDDKDILKILDKSKEFTRLSPSVRSQLKRACELHNEYEAYLNNLQRKVVGHA